MFSRFAVRGFTAGILLVLLHVVQSTAHHSFAPHFDASKKVNIAGTVKVYEAKNPHSYLHVNAVDENGRTRRVRVRIAWDHATEPHWDHAAALQTGNKNPHHGFFIAARPVHVLFREH